MKKLLMDLQLFAGGHSVTVLKDSHMTTASASSTTTLFCTSIPAPVRRCALKRRCRPILNNCSIF